MSKRILYAAIHDWKSTFRVGSHAICHEFLRAGWEVAYISAPLTPFHWLRRKSEERDRRWQNHKAGGVREKNNMLWHYVPFAAIAPSRKTPFTSPYTFRNWQDTTLPDLISLATKQGFGEVDVLFLDTIYQPFWLNSIRYSKAFYRVADNYSGFGGYKAGALMAENEIISKVDHVLLAARTMEAYIRSKGAHSITHLPNGVDCGHFGTKQPKPPEYHDIQKPIAIYIGHIGDWFDCELVATAAKALPSASFVLIGPVASDLSAIKGLDNIHILGARPHDIIPAYLQHARIGIIPFKVSRYPDLINNVNPLKLYEYMACGLPVVATEWSELRNLGSPARLCLNSTEFINQIQSILDLDDTYDEEVYFALNSSWNNRVAPLLEMASKLD